MVEARGLHDEDRETRKRRDRRRMRFALLASLAFHILLLLFSPFAEIPGPGVAAGPLRGDTRAARGELDVISMSSAPPSVIVPPRPPVITLDAITPVPVEFVPTLELDLPPVPSSTSGAGTTTGDDPAQSAGAGVPSGSGRGNAGNAVAGNNRATAPVPLSIFPPESNDALRGRSMQVRVYVNEQGQVVPDSTRLSPPTSNENFNRQVLQNASTWRFRPARQNNAPVGAWFTYDIGM